MWGLALTLTINSRKWGCLLRQSHVLPRAPTAPCIPTALGMNGSIFAQHPQGCTGMQQVLQHQSRGNGAANPAEL